MDLDEEYLDSLLKSLEPIVGPDDSDESSDSDFNSDVPEEELLTTEVEPQEEIPELNLTEPEVVEAVEEPVENSVSEPVEENIEPAAPVDDIYSVLDVNPEEGNKVLSPDEIAAMFAAVGGDAVPEGMEPKEEPVEETAATEEEPSPLAVDPEDANKMLSPDEIAAMFAAAGGDAVPEGMEPKEEPAEEEQSTIENVDTEAVDDISLDVDVNMDGIDMDAGEEDSDADSMDPMAMSADEIDAMLEAAKKSAEEPTDLGNAGDDDLMALLKASGDEDLGEIQDLLSSDENAGAIDFEAVLSTDNMEDVASTVLADEEDEKARRKREKQEAKEAKKAAKKEKKKGKAKDADSAETAENEAEKKPSIFSKILNALTETVDEEDEETSKESADGEIVISDENREILEELDNEKGKKKSKKAKKEKKAKKGKKDKAAGGEDSVDDIREKGDEEAAEGGKKKKAKKPKKQKVKKVKDETPQKREKKLPKKRVIATFVLCLSLLAAILVGAIGISSISNLREARWAFDNQDYETAYEDLYGLELGEEDTLIYHKSQTILLLNRKYESYQNYNRLGMRAEALNALIQAVKDYPQIRENASKYGVEGQVDYIYSQVLDALAEFGITEIDAQEIAHYDSKVKYNLRIQSIVTGSPFTYDEDAASAVGDPIPQVTTTTTQTMDDILPEESDFLPDDPNSIFESDTNVADTSTVDALPDEIDDISEGREIEAEVEIIDSNN